MLVCYRFPYNAELEQLLVEASGQKPSYLDNMPKMDQKLFSEGFARSPSQFNTPAMGNCGPEGKYLYLTLFMPRV